LGLDYIQNVTTAYVAAEHRIRVTTFLVKYINVYSQQIYTTTHKNKLKSTQLKSFLPHFGLAT